ncbi:hypothetical protein SAMN02745146_3738 [Hymenobacter daecheongensis DSM 21074]|uniref:Uncharacterized protein n=1 Tax=Hymenobacter daecheongensis DSM 21074 TaxID=1121955 RepID=A0A1M6LEY1_9BACT|nr:hypothetical protein SAMN02745146_3738 [Hymenobacter daecheongensis DSM 21074]
MQPVNKDNVWLTAICIQPEQKRGKPVSAPYGTVLKIIGYLYQS